MEQQTCKPVQQRVEYIDRLKGFAMLSVVISHVILFGVLHRGNELFLFVTIYMMPLFFLLSGVVISNAPDFKKFVVKAGRFMMPFLCIGLLFTYLKGDDWNFFFYHNYKRGYWYLYVLTVFYLMLTTFRFLPNGKNKKTLIMELGLALVFWIILNALDRTVPTHLHDLFCLGMLARYWFYFSAGYIIRKYNFISLLSANWLYTFALLLFLVGGYFYIQVSARWARPASLAGVVFFFSWFMSREGKTSRVETMLATFGKSSLDIYTLHYFLMLALNLQILAPWFLQTNNLLLFTLLCAAISIVISYLSIYLGRFLHHSDLLEQVVYGKMFEKLVK